MTGILMADQRHFKLLAASLPLVALLVLDLVLRLLGAVPPDDPLLFYRESFDPEIEVFVEVGDDYVVRPDWTSSGDGFRTAAGDAPGQFVILPGFRPARIARHKDPRTLRVFAVGESTTFGLGVGPEAAFAGVIERQLAAAFPDHPVEVVNLGCPGWASPRVANLVRGLVRLEPDLLIVYSGHNEMLGGQLGERPTLGRRERLTAALLRFSPSFAWLHHALSRARNGREARLRESDQAATAGRVLVYDPLNLPAADRHLPPPALARHAAEVYGRNLRAMVDTARGAGVPILFLMPVANLMLPPAYSAHPDGFPERAAFDRLLAEAESEASAGRFATSAEQIDAAIRLSPEHALPYYWRGMLLLRQGRTAAARASFQAAVDRDVRTHRITSALEQVLIDTAKATGAPWIDLRPVLQEPLGSEIAQERFIDFCHPTTAGHRLIAEHTAPLAIRLLAARVGGVPASK